MKLRAIIIDDESNQRENIRMILENHCSDIEVVAEGKTAIEGASIIAKHNPDVVFLDVEMPGGTGFDLLESIGIIEAKVILVTAYSNYMKRGYKVNAFDYLVKPIDIGEMLESIERLRAESSIVKQDGRKVALPSSNGLLYVEKNSISFIRAQGSYSEVNLVDNETLLISKNLKYFESIFNCDQFMRVHRSCIVNVCQILEFSRSEGGLVKLDKGVEIPVANDKREILLQKLSSL